MVLSIINIVAIIDVPILAVVIGQNLQDRSEKRKDKIYVFRHLMSYRSFGYTDQLSVNMLNMVPIVFYKDEAVIEKYNIYIKSLNIKPEDIEQKTKEIDDNKTKMLEEMAKALKYKNINWELIQNPYIPVGLLNHIEQENIFKQGQVSLAKMVSEKMNEEKQTNGKVSAKKKDKQK